MDLKVRTTDYLNEDQSWLGSAHATDTGETVTIDLSTFDFTTAFPNGFLPSGVALGKITATGEYGLYGASPNEVQTLTFDATGGTYTLTVDGETTPNITYANAAGDTATIKAALEALSNLQPGDVTVVRGTPAGNVTAFTVTFTGNKAGQDIPAITKTTALTGGGTSLTVGQVTTGGGAVSDGREVGQGLLLTRVRVDADNKTGKAMGSILRHCIVRESKLPVGHGVDAAFKVDTAGRIIFS